MTPHVSRAASAGRTVIVRLESRAGSAAPPRRCARSRRAASTARPSRSRRSPSPSARSTSPDRRAAGKVASSAMARVAGSIARIRRAPLPRRSPTTTRPSLASAGPPSKPDADDAITAAPAEGAPSAPAARVRTSAVPAPGELQRRVSMRVRPSRGGCINCNVWRIQKLFSAPMRGYGPAHPKCREGIRCVCVSSSCWPACSSAAPRRSCPRPTRARTRATGSCTSCTAGSAPRAWTARCGTRCACAFRSGTGAVRATPCASMPATGAATRGSPRTGPTLSISVGAPPTRIAAASTRTTRGSSTSPITSRGTSTRPTRRATSRSTSSRTRWAGC